MNNAAVDTQKKSRQFRSGPLARTKSEDMSAAREIFLMCALTMEPADRTLRQSVKALIPEIFVLRNQGFSWPQLASLLKEACNIDLLPSTVRSYFNEMLIDRQEECTRRMNEQVLLLAEIKKETEGAKLPGIANKVMAIMERQRKISCIEERMETVFGHGDRRAPIEHEEQAKPREAASPPRVLKTTPASPAPVTPSPAIVSAYTNDEPTVPVVEATINNLKCVELPSGIKPLPRRPEVPEEIYDSENMMEHPAIPGLMLSKPARVFGAYLEMIDGDGAIRVETSSEKRFRIKWQKPVKMEKSSTSGDFVQIDPALFGKPS